MSGSPWRPRPSAPALRAAWFGASRGRTGRDSLHFLRIAPGSAEESLACLFVAQAWGYVHDEQIADAIARLHHLSNRIFSLTRRG